MVHTIEPTESSVEFRISGKYALFSDIALSVGGEKFSTPIPSYEAIKGVLHSIYWKPTFIWVVDEVRVMNKIRTTPKGVKTYVFNSKDPTKRNDLSYYTYLCDVEYQVRAHFEWNMNRPECENDRLLKKHLSIAQRAIKSGGRRDIYLGTRECQAYVGPCVFGSGMGYYDNIEEITYGVMYHGITYPDETIQPDDRRLLTVRFWEATMKHGIIHYPAPEDCMIKRHIKQSMIKPFPRRTEEEVED